MTARRIHLLDGDFLEIGDVCRAMIGGRWRRVRLLDITKGTGVERGWVDWPGNGSHLVSRYRLRR